MSPLVPRGTSAFEVLDNWIACRADIAEVFGTNRYCLTDQDVRQLAAHLDEWIERGARRIALLAAADAWEAADVDDLRKLAEEHYRPGGPSMPTIWLRLRAEEERSA